MGRYRKKPVVVEAVRYTGDIEEMRQLYILGDDSPWVKQAVNKNILYPKPVDGTVVMVVKTLEGDHICNPGDWIIRGVKGELYPCKPDIFEATYESVNSKPDEQSERSMLHVWQTLKDVRVAVDSVLPDSREKSLCLTKLDEARMWMEHAPKMSKFF